MRYPTRKLLRCLQRKPPGRDFWLPELTVREAWVLTEFLDEIQEAIWMDYGGEIAAYLEDRDVSDFRSFQNPDSGRPGPVRLNTPEDIPF